MFLGEYNHAIDAKGRIFVPAKYRDDLGNTFVITRGIDSCLTVYPMAEWEKFSGKINEMPPTQARKIRRFIYANASDVEVDSQGRVLLSESLRTYAGIEKNAVIIGLGSYLEIWSDENWNKERETETSDEIADLMVALGC